MRTTALLPDSRRIRPPVSNAQPNPALSPHVRPQRKPNLRALVLPESQPCRSHQFLTVGVGYGQHVLGARVRHRTGQSGLHDSADLLDVLGLKAEMPGRIGVPVDLVQPAGIVLAELPEHKRLRPEPDWIHALPSVHRERYRQRDNAAAGVRQ